MLKPAFPVNEAARIDRLHALNILDTAAEERFDRLTRLASRLFNVPIALVSLVDMNRQWFKSCVGLGASETPRDISFCGHAILGDDIFCIPDARADERFADNPLVTSDPHIRFYAGCPLTVSEGIKVGTLCLIDTVPHEFGAEDRTLLHDLAMLVEKELTAIQIATIDELTGLSNRLWLRSVGDRTLGLCVRHKKPAVLFFFDLDRFKAVNDRFGHAEGDSALKTFANLLSQTFRTSDIVVRLGGDEFVALVTDCTVADSKIAINRLQHVIDGYNLTSQRGYDLAFSVGVIAYDPAEHGSFEELLAEADNAMYERKRQRRLS